VVTWEYFVASEASCRGACTGGADVDDTARRVSHRLAPACRPSSLGAVYGETARRSTLRPARVHRGASWASVHRSFDPRTRGRRTRNARACTRAR
jgi:hypothetical protein